MLNYKINTFVLIIFFSSLVIGLTNCSFVAVRKAGIVLKIGEYGSAQEYARV